MTCPDVALRDRLRWLEGAAIQRLDHHRIGSATPAAEGSDGDCMGGGTLALDSKDCKFWGEVMGATKRRHGHPHAEVLLSDARGCVQNTGGCEVADCTADKAVPAKVICKDTTHGGVPTNP
jgi:hypothetical protein